MPRNLLNLVGEQFNKLLVIEEAEKYITPNGTKQRRWLCKCECGNETVVKQSHLRNNHTQSCGCYQKERAKETHTTHGKSKRNNKKHTKEYNCWIAIKERCLNPNTSNYCNYGGRGITVAPEWVNNFEAFFQHIGPAPHPKASIDRIDNNGNYEPGNIRWVNQTIQNINKRLNKNNSSGYKGIHQNKTNDKWCARIGINNKLIHLGLFNTKEEAITARKNAEEQYHKPLLN